MDTRHNNGKIPKDYQHTRTIKVTNTNLIIMKQKKNLAVNTEKQEKGK